MLPNLPPFLIAIFGVIIPALAIAVMVVNYTNSIMYWRDSKETIEGLRTALIGLREKNLVGILLFDLAIMELANNKSPEMNSPLARATIYLISDAKGLICNEISLARISNPDKFISDISSEISFLTHVLSTRNTIQSFNTIGKLIIFTMLHGDWEPKNYYEGTFPIDSLILETFINISNELIKGRGDLLMEELAVRIDTLSEDDWKNISPIVALVLYWLRMELFHMYYEESVVVDTPNVIRTLFASEEELLSLTLSNLAYAIVEGDMDIVVNEMSKYYSAKRRVPLFIARWRQERYIEKTKKYAGISFDKSGVNLRN